MLTQAAFGQWRWNGQTNVSRVGVTNISKYGTLMIGRAFTSSKAIMAALCPLLSIGRAHVLSLALVQLSKAWSFGTWRQTPNAISWATGMPLHIFAMTGKTIQPSQPVGMRRSAFGT